MSQSIKNAFVVIAVAGFGAAFAGSAAADNVRTAPQTVAMVSAPAKIVKTGAKSGSSTTQSQSAATDFANVPYALERAATGN